MMLYSPLGHTEPSSGPPKLSSDAYPSPSEPGHFPPRTCAEWQGSLQVPWSAEGKGDKSYNHSQCMEMCSGSYAQMLLWSYTAHGNLLLSYEHVARLRKKILQAG